MEIIRGERQGVPFYFCPDSAWSGAAHGFSTRLGGVSPPPWDSLNLGAARGDAPERVAENFRRFCAAVGADPGALVKNHQVSAGSPGRTFSLIPPPPACTRPTVWSPTSPACA